MKLTGNMKSTLKGEELFLASDHSMVECYGFCKGAIKNYAKAILHDRCSIEACNSTKVMLYDYSEVECWDYTEVYGFDNSSIVASGRCQILAFGENVTVKFTDWNGQFLRIDTQNPIISKGALRKEFDKSVKAISGYNKKDMERVCLRCGSPCLTIYKGYGKNSSGVVDGMIDNFQCHRCGYSGKFEIEYFRYAENIEYTKDDRKKYKYSIPLYCSLRGIEGIGMGNRGREGGGCPVETHKTIPEKPIKIWYYHEHYWTPGRENDDGVVLEKECSLDCPYLKEGE
jgi:hypothetical protein